MAQDYSRFGTRISLSDRFSLIRKEAAKRAIVVNPTIDSPQVPRDTNKVMKNFNGTINRADRPSAALHQGSEKNKRLVYQMAVAPSVLAEINHSYEPQIRAQYPGVVHPVNLRNQSIYRPPAAQVITPQQQKRSIRQRLGASQNGIHHSSVKSRLGIKRKPISQRIGLPKVTTPSNGFSNRVRNMNNGATSHLRAKNTVAFKRKSLAAKFNLIKGAKNLRGNKPPLTGRKQPIPSQQQPKPVTAEQLDQDLDVYMRKTKGFLNADLDAYMAQA